MDGERAHHQPHGNPGGGETVKWAFIVIGAAAAVCVLSFIIGMFCGVLWAGEACPPLGS